MTQAFRVDPFNAGQSRVLRIVAEGGRIEARRYYPFPRKYRLKTQAGHEFSAYVPEGTVSTLTEHFLIRPVVLDVSADTIDYVITTRGVKAVRDKRISPLQSQQLDLV